MPRERLKPLDKLLEPDDGSQSWAYFNPDSEEHERVTLAAMHKRADQFALAEDVPDDISNMYLVAVHLYVFGWFVYRFAMVSQVHALSVLELALRLRLDHDSDDHPPGLKRLLTEACTRNCFRDDRFAACPPEEAGPGCAWFKERMIRFLPQWRNALAHGHTSQFPDHGWMLGLVRDALNQLYEPSNG